MAIRNRMVLEMLMLLAVVIWAATIMLVSLGAAGTARPTDCYDIQDFARLKVAYSCGTGDGCYDAAVDYDASGRVDLVDFNILRRGFGQCPDLPWLATEGGRIVRADTREPVEMRGVNLLRWEWVQNMNFERAAIPQLANTWHANLILHGFASEPVAAGDAAYLAVLDEYQQLAEQNHMYIIFAYYYPTINGDQPPNPGVDSASEDALVALVARYRDKSNVL